MAAVDPGRLLGAAAAAAQGSKSSLMTALGQISRRAGGRAKNMSSTTEACLVGLAAERGSGAVKICPSDLNPPFVANISISGSHLVEP